MVSNDCLVRNRANNWRPSRCETYGKNKGYLDTKNHLIDRFNNGNTVNNTRCVATNVLFDTNTLI